MPNLMLNYRRLQRHSLHRGASRSKRLLLYQRERGTRFTASVNSANHPISPPSSVFPMVNSSYRAMDSITNLTSNARKRWPVFICHSSAETCGPVMSRRSSGANGFARRNRISRLFMSTLKSEFSEARRAMYRKRYRLLHRAVAFSGKGRALGLLLENAVVFSHPLLDSLGVGNPETCTRWL